MIMDVKFWIFIQNNGDGSAHARFFKTEQEAESAAAADDKYGDRVFNQALKALGLNRLFLHALRLRVPSGEGWQEYVHNYLPKPFESEELLGIVRDAFECLGAGPVVESSGGREGEN